jgi:hypothetical protein
MKIRIVPIAVGLVAATGIAITAASLASADPTSPTSTLAAYGQGAPGQTAPRQGEAPKGNGNTDPSKPMRSDETLLTGDVAAKVTAAAKTKEPSATIERVETDSDGIYEAHMVRADGTHIIVQVDKSYAVTDVQVGGVGGPGGKPGQGTAPTSPSAQSSSTT